MNSGTWAINSNQNAHSFAVHKEAQLCTYPSGLVSAHLLLHTSHFPPTADVKILRKTFGHSQTHVATGTRTAERLPGGAQVASATHSRTPQLLLASRGGSSEVRPMKVLITRLGSRTEVSSLFKATKTVPNHLQLEEKPFIS